MRTATLTATAIKQPPKPADVSNGLIAPTTHDKEVSNEVLAVLVPADTLTFSVSGSPYLRVSDVSVFDLVPSYVDPSELPPGQTGVIASWDEELSAQYDGSTLVTVSKGQRVHVRVALKVPELAIPPGAVSGLLTVRGNVYSNSVALLGTYLAVADNTPIAAKWKAMGGEAFFGAVTSNAHSMPGVPGTIQDFVNGSLWDTGNGVFCFAADVMAKWRSPSVQFQTTPGTFAGEVDTVAATLGPPVEDTYTTSDGGHGLHFDDGLIVTHGSLPIAPCVIYSYIATAAHGTPNIGLPISDVLVSPDGTATYAHFQNGSIATRSGGGPYVMSRPIRDKWIEFGEGAGVLGYPANMGADDNGAITVVGFDGGAIYSGLAIGTHEVHGPLAPYIDEQLGYPVSDVMPWINPVGGASGIIINCQRGRIAWTSQDGVIFLPA